MTRPQLMLRLEGALAGGIALAAYFHYHYPWWLLLALVLAPDLTFTGYLGGPLLGASLYNAAHSYVGPLIVLAYGVLGTSSAAVAVALIWIVHIGGDRALGYGLKYPTAFKDTHLGRV
jgi:hypothetical protein